MKETRKQQLRDIMIQAWRICKVTGETFAECLKRSWMIVRLKKAMKSGIVQFFFMKQNGELRQAFGTTDPTRYEYTPTGDRPRAPYADCVQYWDTVKQGFRMFKTYNLKSIAL